MKNSWRQLEDLRTGGDKRQAEDERTRWKTKEISRRKDIQLEDKRDKKDGRRRSETGRGQEIIGGQERQVKDEKVKQAEK